MKFDLGLPLAFAALFAPGCYDDSSPQHLDTDTSALGSGGSASTQPSSSSANGSTAAQGSSTTGETTGQPVETVSVSGRVRMGGLLAEASLPNAVVSLWGDPTISAVSDGDGQFELTGIPANTVVHLVTTHPDYRPGINSLQTGSEDAVQFGVPMVSLALLEDAGPTFPNADLDLGLVFFVSSHVDTTIDAVAGGVSIIQPGLYYANTEAGVNLNDNVTHLPQYPIVGVLNVPNSAPGSLVVTATHPTLDCVPNPSVTTPVDGGHATTLFILCD